jgi:hypothetical protein
MAQKGRAFIATACKLGVDESEAAQERAFGSVGLLKANKRSSKK